MAEEVEALIVGAGPAGLAAAEALVARGIRPIVAEARPSVARKLLMAGKSGLNLTKDEPPEAFLSAYGGAADKLRPMLNRFGPREAVAWAEALGEAMFTGSSGRVFPVAMKGSPLLRRWLGRLPEAEIRTRWRWAGWQDGAFAFETPEGPRRVRAAVTVLALGGGSWPRLGSDAAWLPWLEAVGVTVAPFQPANMGFDVGWSDHFRTRFAGQPVKTVCLSLGARRVRGEFVISGRGASGGIEGSAVYALSAGLRDALEAGEAALLLDLLPDRDEAKIARRLARPRGRNSLANHLRKAVGLEGVKAGLLRELAPHALPDPAATARAAKALALPVLRPRPLREAISSAGGIPWDALDDGLMLRALPGVHVAGEMIDWEAPTGGYLLTACLATGFHAGRTAAERLGRGGG